MTHIVTQSGFEIDIEENKLDDMEFLELVCDIDGGNILAYRKLINKLMSAEDKERLYNHVRGEDGRVPLTAVGAEITAVLERMNTKKK